MKYQLIHIPKTGGCAFFHPLYNKYPDVFDMMGHEFETGESQNPIVTVRYPMDRISSIYQFWTKGSEEFKFNFELNFEEFLEVAENTINSTPNDKSNIKVFLEEAWETYGGTIHMLPQHKWLQNEHYSKTIVVVYQENLQECASKLMSSLGLQSFQIPRINVTKNKEEMKFSRKELKKILSLYACDFDLWYNVMRYPQKFKKVIYPSVPCDKPLLDYLRP